MVKQSKAVRVNWKDLPESIRETIAEENDWRFRNDISLCFDDGFSWEILKDYDQYIKDVCKAHCCTEEEWLEDSQGGWLSYKLFQIYPEAFRDYDGVIYVDICW